MGFNPKTNVYGGGVQKDHPCNISDWIVFFFRLLIIFYHNFFNPGKIVKMAASEVLRGEIWVFYSLDFILGDLGWPQFYTIFVVGHARIRSHKIISEFVQYLTKYK